MPGLLVTAIQSSAQSTAIGYQGQLGDNGAPANGIYDIQFTAYDALTGGNLVGATVTINGVSVHNGVFSTPVDLGAAVFTGPDRWLEIAVSPTGAGTFQP